VPVPVRRCRNRDGGATEVSVALASVQSWCRFRLSAQARKGQERGGSLSCASTDRPPVTRFPSRRAAGQRDAMRCDALARRGQSIPDSSACNCSNRRRPVERGEASIGRPASQPCPETVSLTVPVPVAVPHLGISNRSVRARSRPESIFRSITAPTRTRPAHRSRRAHSFASCCPVEDEMHARARARTGTERGSEGWGAERRIDPGGAGGGRSMDLGCARGGAAGACHGRAGGLSVRSIPTSRVGSTGHGRMDPRPARLHHCMRLRPTATGRWQAATAACLRGRTVPGTEWPGTGRRWRDWGRWGALALWRWWRAVGAKAQGIAATPAGRVTLTRGACPRTEEDTCRHRVRRRCSLV
jgi:hypothetical protein